MENIEDRLRKAADMARQEEAGEVQPGKDKGEEVFGELREELANPEMTEEERAAAEENYKGYHEDQDKEKKAA